MTTELRCRFDREGHGTFVTPVLLGRHYAEQHADQWTPKRGVVKASHRCRLCGGEYLNPQSHIQQKHPDEFAAGPPFVSRYFDKVDPTTPSRSVDVLDTLHDIEDQRRNGSRVPRHVGPWEVDDIVLPVVEQLASPKGLIPVAHLAAILAWRDATAVMLAAVTT